MAILTVHPKNISEMIHMGAQLPCLEMSMRRLLKGDSRFSEASMRWMNNSGDSVSVFSTPGGRP